MNQLLNQLNISINERIYSKDPASSELGQRILRESLVMIEEMGIEHFNFKKLAQKLNTTETSIYRYFENKHKLLIYHVSWFWTSLDYRLVFSINNLHDPTLKLEKALALLVNPVKGFEKVQHVEMSKLYEIVINESYKVFLTKEVDLDNREGFFKAFKSFCGRISQIIQEINPNYAYPKSLVSSIVEGILLQKYFASHLPTLSDSGKDDKHLEGMFFHLICQTLKVN